MGGWVGGWVAYLEAVGSMAEDDEAFEEGLGESGLGRSLADDHRGELAVVPYHDELLAAHDDGDEAFGFHCLGGLINQHCRWVGGWVGGWVGWFSDDGNEAFGFHCLRGFVNQHCID